MVIIKHQLILYVSECLFLSIQGELLIIRYNLIQFKFIRIAFSDNLSLYIIFSKVYQW